MQKSTHYVAKSLIKQSNIMANTYTQIFIHIVFIVQKKECLIKEHFRVELEKYICGIVAGNKSKTIAI